MERRRLCLDGEVWTIELDGLTHKVLFGEKTITRVFATPEKARRSFEEHIAYKLQEGYTQTGSPGVVAPQKEAGLMTPTRVDLEKHKREWLQDLGQNQQLTTSLLTQALAQGKNITQVAEAYYEEHVAPGVRAAAPAPEPVASTSRKVTSLGERKWALNGSLEQLVGSPDGKLLVLSRRYNSVNLIELDPATGQSLRSLSVAVEVSTHDELSISARVAPNGTLAIFGPCNSTVSVWDLGTASLIRQLAVEGSNKRGRARLEFSPDGSRLAIHCDRLQVFALPSGDELISQEVSPEGLAFSPDGQRVAWCEGSELHIQPMEGLPQVISGDWSGCKKLAWSPGGERIGILARRFHFVEIASGAGVAYEYSPPGTNIENCALAFSADGTTVYLGASGTSMQRYQVGQKTALAKWGRLAPNLTGLALGPGGKHIFVSHGSDPDCSTEFLSGQLYRFTPPRNVELLSEFGWRVLAADTSGRFVEDAPSWNYFSEPARLVAWLPEQGRTRALGLRRKGTIAVIAPRGGWAAWSPQAKQISVADLSSGQEPTLVAGCTPLGFSRDARHLLVQAEGKAQMYLLDEFAPPRVVWEKDYKSMPQSNSYASAALDPEARRVVMTGTGWIQAFDLEKDILLWEDEWSTRGQISQNTLPHEAETFVSYLGEGRYVVLCHFVDTRAAITCYDAASGQKLGTREPHVPELEAPFKNLFRLWQPSATRLLLPSETGYSVWNLADPGEEVALSAARDGSFFEHGYPVLSFDGRLAAVPEPGRVRVFSLPQVEQVDEIETETENPACLTWVPGSYRLITRGPGHSYQVWQVQDDPQSPTIEEAPALGERQDPLEEEAPLPAEVLRRAEELEAGLEWFATHFDSVESGDLEALAHLARTSQRREVQAAALSALPAALGEQRATPGYYRAVLKHLEGTDPHLLELSLQAAPSCLKVTPMYGAVVRKLAELVMHEPEPRLRWLAMTALTRAAKLPAEILRAAEGALADEHPRVVIQGMALNKVLLSDPQKTWYLERIRPLLKHTEPLVRQLSLREALQIEQSQELLQQAMDLLKDPDVSVRVDAAEVIESLRYLPALPALLECLEDEELGFLLKLSPLSGERWFYREERTLPARATMLNALERLAGSLTDIPRLTTSKGREASQARQWYSANQAAIGEQIRSWAAANPAQKVHTGPVTLVVSASGVEAQVQSGATVSERPRPEGLAPAPAPAAEPGRGPARPSAPSEQLEHERKALEARAARLQDALAEASSLPSELRTPAHGPTLLYLAEHSERANLVALCLEALPEIYKYQEEPYAGPDYRRVLMKHLSPPLAEGRALFYALEGTQQFPADQELKRKVADLACTHPLEWVRDHCLGVLGNWSRTDPEGQKALCANLQSDVHPQVARTALCWAGGSEELLSAVRPFLECPEPALRAAALEAAVRSGSVQHAEVQRALERGLKDPSALVRETAVVQCWSNEYAPAMPIMATHGPDEARAEPVDLRVDGPFSSRYGHKASTGSDRIDSKMVSALEYLSRYYGLPEFKSVRGEVSPPDQARQWYEANRAAVDQVVEVYRKPAAAGV